MIRSAIEQGVDDKVASLAAFCRAHDRGVVAGLALCCVPIPPAPLFGLIISVVNLLLLRTGRLHAREARVVLAACAIGTFNLGIAIGIVVLGFRLFSLMTTGISRFFDAPARLGPGLRSISVALTSSHAGPLAWMW